MAFEKPETHRIITPVRQPDPRPATAPAPPARPEPVEPVPAGHLG